MRAIKKRSKELIPKNKAKKSKSNKFTRSNIEKTNIAIAIFEKMNNWIAL